MDNNIEVKANDKSYLFRNSIILTYNKWVQLTANPLRFLAATDPSRYLKKQYEQYG